MSDIKETDEAVDTASQAAEANDNPFALLDWTETDPTKRIAQAQSVRAMLLVKGMYPDKEQTKLLKDFTATDLSLLRLDVDKDSSASQRELAQSIARSFMERDDAPIRTVDASDKSPVPSVDETELGDSKVEEWSMERHMGSPDYDELMQAD